MNPLRKLASQTAIYGISSIVGRLFNYLLVPLYTRVFTTDQYGVVTEMYAYVSFLIVILTYGMETSFFKFSVDGRIKKKVFGTALFSILSSTSLFIVLCFSFSIPIGNWLGYPQHTEYVKWFALIIGLDAMSAIPLAKLRSMNKAGYFMGVNLANVGVNIALNIFFLVYCKQIYASSDGHPSWIAEHFYNPDIGIGYVFISNLVASSVKLLLLSPVLFKDKLQLDFKLWRMMIIYALPLLIGGLAGIINETADRVMLKHFLPLNEKDTLTQLGIYGACYKISILMTLFVQAFRFAAEPFFFAKQKDKNASLLYGSVMNYFVLICSVLFLAIMLYIQIVIRFIGAEFREGIHVVPILLMANLCLGIYFNLSVWYKLSGKTIYGALLALFGAAITIILNYIWIPTIGYMGSAWATLICYASMVIASYIMSRKHFKVPYNIIKMISYPLAAYVFYLLSKQISFDSGIFKYTCNALLLLLFISVAIMIEKPWKLQLKTDQLK